MEFNITLSNGSIPFDLKVYQIGADPGYERFIVSSGVNPKKYVIIQGNRPHLRNSFPFSRRLIKWTLIEGTIRDKRTFRQIVKKIGEVIEPKLK